MCHTVKNKKCILDTFKSLSETMVYAMVDHTLLDNFKPAGHLVDLSLLAKDAEQCLAAPVPAHHGHNQVKSLNPYFITFDSVKAFDISQHSSKTNL